VPLDQHHKKVFFFDISSSHMSVLIAIYIE